MASSQRGVAVGQGLRRSAETNRCPVCQRGAALKTVVTNDRYGEVCRWSEQGLCDYPGAFVARVSPGR